MSLFSNIVCQRCHRQYPSFRGQCPYCGTKKPQETKRTLPESDTAIRGTAAARRAVEDLNWQMLVGGLLLVCVMVAVITLVSVNIKNKTGGTILPENTPDLTMQTTPVPTPTMVPTATPEPTTPVTSVELTHMGVKIEDFSEPRGSVIKLDANPFPANNDVVFEWASSDESIATVDQDGNVTIMADSGYCTVTATAPNGMSASCIVRGK